MNSWTRGPLGWLQRIIMSQNPIDQEPWPAIQPTEPKNGHGSNYRSDVGEEYGYEEEYPTIRLKRLFALDKDKLSIIIAFPRNTFITFCPRLVHLLLAIHGLKCENLYLHLWNFNEVCLTFQEPNCCTNYGKFMLFLFSLKERAKSWLNSLRPWRIKTWQEIQE